MLFFKNKNTKLVEDTSKIKISADWNYIYTVHDKIAKRCVGVFLGTSDAVMLRTSLPHIIMDYSFRDIEIYRIARVDMVTGLTESIPRKVIPLNSYLFAHSRLSPEGEDLSMETLEKAMHDLKTRLYSQLDKKRVVENKEVEKHE